MQDRKGVSGGGSLFCSRSVEKSESDARTPEFFFETLGSWGPECVAFVHDLGRRLTLATGDTREPAFLRQRLSIAVQRGNVLAVRGTVTLDDVNDDGHRYV
jgi:hypothetical protein